MSGNAGFADLSQAGLYRTPSGCVAWKPLNAAHPRNWSSIRKTSCISLVFFLEFFVTVIATTGPSSVHYARSDPRFASSSEETLLVCFAFAYSFGQACGALAIPPFTEAFGRKWYYIWSTAAFSIACVVVGATPTVAGVLMGRLISGTASAVPAVVVAGSVEDLFDQRQRVWLVWLWNCFTVAGQVLGPIYGSYIAAALGWPWVYYISAIVMAGMLPLVIIAPETRHYKVLERFIEKKCSPPSSGSSTSDSESEAIETLKVHNPDSNLTLTRVLIRPSQLLFTEPLIFTATLLTSFSMGLIYLFTEALSHVYTSTASHFFGFDYTTASLPFLAMVLGILFSILPRFLDVRRHASCTDPAKKPELKLTGFALGAPALAVGLWIFAWTIPPLVTDVHWLASCAGLLLIGFAATEISYTLQGYLADAYTVYASSALSGLACVRALVGGVMPLFARQLFDGLNNNWAVTLLAGCATFFLLALVVFVRYGRSLRERSRFAQLSLQGALD